MAGEHFDDIGEGEAIGIGQFVAASVDDRSDLFGECVADDGSAAVEK